MTEQDEIARGHDAERLLNDPMLKEAFSKVETGIVDGLKQTPIGDRDTQHELTLCLQLLGRVKKNLEEVATTGKFALHQKQERESWMKRQLKKVA
jgi:hypothetical protein